MKYISITCDDEYVALPFYKDECPAKENAPCWGMTLKKAGTMRFRWDETNTTRDAMLKRIATTSDGTEALATVPLELIHSKIVYDVKEAHDTFGKQGDGIVTINKSLLPTLTVADCMPIFFWDEASGIFGLVHSGWRGTGIIKTALELAVRNYGAEVERVCIAMGPHIRDCCYIVDESRAVYFRENFSSDCVTPYEKSAKQNNAGKSGAKRNNASDEPLNTWNTRGGKLYHLSLEKANLAILHNMGVKDENIICATDCTCCDEHFGSFRRETAGLAENEKQRRFHVQAAFCGWLRQGAN